MFPFKKRIDHSNVEIDAQRILTDETPFAIKEAYRSLYTNVLYLSIESKAKKIGVTSAVPGEGKTMVSINLAKTIAINSADSKILLVDADMRSPRVSALMGLDGHKLSGLSEYLAGIDKEPAIISTEYPNLSLLPSGSVNVNSPGLISSNRMKSLVEKLEQTYDYIIFDTPPVNIVSDALLLKDYVNGYLVAVRSEFSDVNSTSDAIESLSNAEATVFGLVLTAYHAKRGKRYGRYYGGRKYGYGYSNYEK